jgi:hypothetical protein
MAIEIKPTQTGVTQSLMQKPLKAEAAADASNRTTGTDTVTVTSAAELERSVLIMLAIVT